MQEYLFQVEVSRLKWDMPPRIVEKDQAEIIWDFQIEKGKTVMANQTVLVDKQRMKAIMIDQKDDIRKWDHEKLQKIPRTEKVPRENVKDVDNSCSHGNQHTQGSNAKTGDWLQQIQDMTSKM